MTIFVRLIGALLACGAAGAATFAQADTLGERVTQCTSCHGESGVPVDKFVPVISGQTEGYLYIQLRDFKRGDRKSEVMGPIAAELSRDDMLALAAYFAGQPWPSLQQPAAPKDVAQRAITANGSVGCTGCHLDHWQGTGTVPRLAGQSYEYLQRTIAEFRSRTRGNNPGMSDLMLATSESDLAAMATYLAGL